MRSLVDVLTLMITSGFDGLAQLMCLSFSFSESGCAVFVLSKHVYLYPVSTYPVSTYPVFLLLVPEVSFEV